MGGFSRSKKTFEIFSAWFSVCGAWTPSRSRWSVAWSWVECIVVLLYVFCNWGSLLLVEVVVSVCFQGWIEEEFVCQALLVDLLQESIPNWCFFARRKQVSFALHYRRSLVCWLVGSWLLALFSWVVVHPRFDFPWPLSFAGSCHLVVLAIRD